jgi:hypothetical protein
MRTRTAIHALFCAAFMLGPVANAARAQGNADYAQPEAAPAEESSGDPLYGYIATAFLGAGAIFAICKSARR